MHTVNELTLFCLSALFGFRSVAPVFSQILKVRGEKKILKRMEQYEIELRDLQEMLQAGIAPSAEKWKTLAKQPLPWNLLSQASILAMRDRGLSLLPTLSRLTALLSKMGASFAQAEQRALQALTQVSVAFLLIPLFAGALYVFLPSLSQHCFLWLGVSAVACYGAMGAWKWIYAMIVGAAWGGLPSHQRPWIFFMMAFLERFLAQLQSGDSVDKAWSDSHQMMRQLSPPFAELIAASLWEEPLAIQVKAGAMLQVFMKSIRTMHAMLHVCLMEGRPSLERALTLSESFYGEVQGVINCEVAKLQVATLKPLFLVMAPSVLGLLGVGLWLEWQS